MDPAEKLKTISITEKREYVAKHMDTMARTMGIRIAAAGDFQKNMDKYKKNKEGRN